jgi:16S rRNA processing protein RimM
MSGSGADEGDLADWCVDVGRVRRPHGVCGEIAVTPLTDRPDRFADLERVAVFPERGTPRLVRIEGFRPVRGLAYLRLEGMKNRNAAEGLRGALLRIRRDMRYELEQGEYWIDDLVGLAAVTDDGRSLGTIREVLTLPANDVYVTEHCLIPALRDMVLAVDLEAKTMTVRAVPGLAPELGI